MAGWGEYAAAWGVFVLTHALPVRPPVKPWLVVRMGNAGYLIAYSALSLAVLTWLIGAAGRAPYIEIWPRAQWQNHVTLVFMAAACLILSLAAGRANPFSFGGSRKDSFDPMRPGIVGLVRHPVLATLMLWALGHLAPNGDLAHVLLFGGFAAFALMGMAIIDRRRCREMGRESWRKLRPARTLRGAGCPLRWLAAALVLVALILLHPVVIGLPAIW